MSMEGFLGIKGKTITAKSAKCAKIFKGFPGVLRVLGGSKEVELWNPVSYS